MHKPKCHFYSSTAIGKEAARTGTITKRNFRVLEGAARTADSAEFRATGTKCMGTPGEGSEFHCAFSI